jgi:hypothetical protein
VYGQAACEVVDPSAPSNPNHAMDPRALGSVARNAGREAEMLFNITVRVRFTGDLDGREPRR